MRTRTLVALAAFVSACKGGGDAPTVTEAATPTPTIVAVNPFADGSVATTALDASSVDASTPDADASDAGSKRIVGSLKLDVRGSYCATADKDKPACRSYTYVLEGDGKIRGGARKSAVPSEEVDALFRDASAAFAEKRSCIPYIPDKGGRQLTLTLDGKVNVADGACGARLDAIGAKLEKLANQR